MGKKGKEKKVNFEWEKGKRDGFAAVSSLYFSINFRV